MYCLSCVILCLNKCILFFKHLLGNRVFRGCSLMFYTDIRSLIAIDIRIVFCQCSKCLSINDFDKLFTAGFIIILVRNSRFRVSLKRILVLAIIWSVSFYSMDALTSFLLFILSKVSHYDLLIICREITHFSLRNLFFISSWFIQLLRFETAFVALDALVPASKIILIEILLQLTYQFF